jgi:hypothetical protein
VDISTARQSLVCTVGKERNTIDIDPVLATRAVDGKDRKIARNDDDKKFARFCWVWRETSRSSFLFLGVFACCFRCDESTRKGVCDKVHYDTGYIRQMYLE